MYTLLNAFTLYPNRISHYIKNTPRFPSESAPTLSLFNCPNQLTFAPFYIVTTIQMVYFVLDIPIASYCLAIYCYNTAFLSFYGNPVYQAGRKFRWISFFKYPSERITVWYSVWKFKKFHKVFFMTFTEFLHIGKIFSFTDYSTQPMIMISSSLLQIFPYVIRLGSLIFLISSFNFFISILLILSFLCKKVNAVALGMNCVSVAFSLNLCYTNPCD